MDINKDKKWIVIEFRAYHRSVTSFESAKKAIGYVKNQEEMDEYDEVGFTVRAVCKITDKFGDVDNWI